MGVSSQWTLRALQAHFGGILSKNADLDTPILDFNVQAWNCRRGQVYLPIHNAPESKAWRVLKNGATGAIAQNAKLSDDTSWLRVPDLQKFADELARTSRDNLDAKFVGITGSAGKSTTKMMLHAVLSRVAPTFATAANRNLVAFTQASLASMPQNSKYAVFELALKEPDLVERSSSLVRPEIGIMTSIGLNHSEFHDDPIRGIIECKSRLFHNLSSPGIAVLPHVDPHFDALLEQAKAAPAVSEIMIVGHDASDVIQLESYEEFATYSVATIRDGQNLYTYRIPMSGLHLINNSLLVAATVKALGLPLDAMEGMEDYVAPQSSVSRFHYDFGNGKEIELIDDAIISSPHQVHALLDMLKKRDLPRRRVLVFGDMSALGPNEVDLHIELTEAIDNSGVDFLITIGPLSEHIAQHSKLPSYSYPDAQEAAKDIERLFKPGDLVAVKASGPTHVKEVIKALRRKAAFKEAALEWTIEDKFPR